MSRSRRSVRSVLPLLVVAGLGLACAATREPMMQPEPPIAPPAVVPEEAPGAEPEPALEPEEPGEEALPPPSPDAVPEAEAEEGTTVDDEVIATKILIKFSSDARLSLYEIDVESRDGHVVLSGEVGSEGARETAGALARQTEGVRSVDNRLTTD